MLIKESDIMLNALKILTHLIFRIALWDKYASPPFLKMGKFRNIKIIYFDQDPLSKWWRQDLNPRSLAPVTALNPVVPRLFRTPGTGFVEDNFSTDGVGEGWFRQ